MRKFFTLIICIAIVSGVFAQDKKSTFGIKASFNLAYITGEEIMTTSMKPGFNVGFVTEFRITNIFALSPEVLYSMQGIKIKGEKAGITSHYVNIPIMAKFYVAKKLSLDIGPQFGYLASMKFKAKEVSVDVFHDIYNKIDISVGAGLTYNFSRMFLSARYNIGLTNVIRENDTATRNSVFQIGIGCKF